MYTITLSIEPMARGAAAVPEVTVKPMVRTRKNLPMNSVI